MKISKLFQLGSALVLSLSTLLTVSIPLVHAAVSNCTWTDGSGSNHNFSTNSNWSCSGSFPSSGSDIYNLVFPASAAAFHPVDNIASLIVGTIAFSGTFSGSGYQVTSSSPSNSISISSGITDTSTGTTGGNEIDGDIALSADQTFSAGSGSQLTVGGSGDTIDLGSNTLTLSNAVVGGSLSNNGSLVIDDALYPSDNDGVDLLHASPGFTGDITVNRGALFVDDAGALSNAISLTIANGALLKGSGGVANAIIQSGGIVAPGHSPGCISSNIMTINGTYQAQIGGTTACTEYDQLQISGSVGISGGTLQASLVNGFTPTVGQSFTIINNTGGSPVTGTFAGLAEGSTFTVGGSAFRISYQGGDGNDVTLTAVNLSTAGSSGSVPGSPNTGLAAVMAQPFMVLAISTTAALSLLAIARRLKTFKVQD